MLKFVAFLAITIYQVSAGAVELLPAAQVASVAPVAAAIVTARSSQYISQTHNALAAPLVAPVAPLSQYITPVAASVSQVTRYAAPIAQYVAPAVASFAKYVAPVAASYSQVTQYASPVAQYVAPAVPSTLLAHAPLLRTNLAVAPAAPLVAKAAPLVASPVLARAPLALSSAQPVASAQPVGPQQPGNTPVPAQNPDEDSIEIESARVRTLPQARNQQQQQNLARSQQSALVDRFQPFSQQNLAQQQALRQNAVNAGVAAEPLVQAGSQQSQGGAALSARYLAQSQQAALGNGAFAAAPGLISPQQYIQGRYFG